MHFSWHLRLLSIFALTVVAPQALFAAGTTGDSTVTSKRYVDGRWTTSSTPKVVIAPTSSGGVAGARDITTAGANITGLESSSSDGATNIPTAYAVKEALTSATNGMITDVSGKQNKPAEAEVAAGKVLTYNGTGDANGTNNYSAKYIQVPVANNAPNGNGTVTVSTLADIWVE